MKKIFFISIILLAVITSCHNGEWEFPDYEYQTVYFAYQYPVRTITLGEDIFDTTLDNDHKCQIVVTTGGVYNNLKDVIINFKVDESLCDGLGFNSTLPIIPMPSNYYSLADNKIVIPEGELTGTLDVQLNDAFFADTLAIERTYVIPLLMTDVENADSILSGEPLADSPSLTNLSDWTTVPKNYILYAVKYVNPWHGAYLRRGIDVGKGKDGNTELDTTIVNHQPHVEEDMVVKMNTISMDEVSMSLKTKNRTESNNVPFELIIKIDDNGNCSVSSPEAEPYTATGDGKFVKGGDEWGGKERDVMYLNYKVDFDISTHTFTDTIVLRDRQVEFETFTPAVL